MSPPTRLAEAAPRRRSPRAGRAAVLLLVGVAAACGKKGPPLSPFPRVPAAVTAVTPTRAGDDVLLAFTVPSANADGRQPADLSRLDVYAITATRAPETEEHRELAARVGELSVRPVLPPLPPLPDGSPAPPPPLPPGVDQGTAAAFAEALTPEARVPVELPDPSRPAIALDAPEAITADEYVEAVTGPLAAPAPIAAVRRFYFLVGVSPRGRESLPSTPVAVPLDAAARPPGAPEVKVTEQRLVVTWAPSPDAKTASLESPPPVVAAAIDPAEPTVPLLPVLPAKSLGFATEATTYHVYELPAASAVQAAAAPAVPVALTPQPLAVTEWASPAVTFGVERCFVVRAVDRVAGVAVMSAPSPATCVTPRDTFPPAAPTSLAAIAGAGVINLIWEPGTEADLAGYLVLRGEAPGTTLRAITPSPVLETTFRDADVRPGVRYVYAVVAVDTADPRNVSAQSNRAEETARQ